MSEIGQVVSNFRIQASPSLCDILPPKKIFQNNDRILTPHFYFPRKVGTYLPPFTYEGQRNPLAFNYDPKGRGEVMHRLDSILLEPNGPNDLICEFKIRPQVKEKSPLGATSQVFHGRGY